MADLEGNEINLTKRLGRERSGPLDLRVRVGRATPVEGRLVAVRMVPENAARRKRTLRARLRAEGNEPRKDQLEMCEWVVVFSNAGAELLDSLRGAALSGEREGGDLFQRDEKRTGPGKMETSSDQ